MTKGQIFREHLQKQPITVLPGVYDCISARLAEKVGFEAVFTSGFGLSASLLGLPDHGYLTATDMLLGSGRIAGTVDIPVIADMDTGYGDVRNVMRTTGECIKLDIAGIILEDQVWPKRCGHFEGKEVIPAQEHARKITAARKISTDNGLVIIGRTDARAPLGLKEAIDRGKRYYDAGADIIFVEAPESIAELEKIASSLPGIPLFANMVEGGKTPPVSIDQLEDLGFKVVVYPLTALFSATKAIELALTHLRANSSTVSLDNMYTFKEFEKFIEKNKYDQS